MKTVLIRAITAAVFLYGSSAHAATSPSSAMKDIFTGINPAGGQPSNFCAVGNTLFFTATDSLHGRELWKSDGPREERS